jgi:hypothetical protein
MANNIILGRAADNLLDNSLPPPDSHLEDAMERTDRQGYGWKLAAAVLALSLMAPGWFGGVLFARW